MMIFIIIYIIIIVLSILNLYFIKRNNKVYDFRMRIIDLTHSGIMLDEELFYKRMYLSDKHSYNKMLYSFKPLKLEYWYTPEEIKLIKLC